MNHYVKLGLAIAAGITGANVVKAAGTGIAAGIAAHKLKKEMRKQIEAAVGGVHVQSDKQ